MEVLNAIREVITTTKNALSDGKLSGDEIKAIVREVLDLASALLGKHVSHEE